MAFLLPFLILGTRGVSAMFYGQQKNIENPIEKRLTDVALNDQSTLSPSDLVKVKLVNNTVIFMSKAHAIAYAKGMCREISPKDAPALWDRNTWGNASGEIKMSWYTLTPFPLSASPLPPSEHVFNITDENFKQWVVHFANCSSVEQTECVELGERKEAETSAHVIKKNIVYQAHFRDSLLDDSGWVVDTQECLAVRTGGCERYRTWRNYNNVKPIASTGKVKFYSNSVEDQAAMHQNRLWGQVVSIAQSRATWHFPMENLLGLAAIDLNILRGSPARPPHVLHIASFSPYTVQWLQVALGAGTRICMIMDPSRLNIPCMVTTSKGFGYEKDENNTQYMYVTTGTVLARQALVPEMGRCGRPSVQQLVWLRDKVSSFLAWHVQFRAHSPERAHQEYSPRGAAQAPPAKRVRLGNIPNVGGFVPYALSRDLPLHKLFETVEDLQRAKKPVKLVVLTTRKKTRRIENDGEVKAAVMDFAGNNSFLFYEHSDLEELSIVDQLRLHQLASIVVGPHGGAEVSLIAMRPHHSCVIEYINWAQPWCYAIVARTMQLHYIALGRNITQHTVSLKELEYALGTCLHQVSDL